MQTCRDSQSAPIKSAAHWLLAGLKRKIEDSYKTFLLETKDEKEEVKHAS